MVQGLGFPAPQNAGQRSRVSVRLVSVSVMGLEALPVYTVRVGFVCGARGADDGHSGTGVNIDYRCLKKSTAIFS